MYDQERQKSITLSYLYELLIPDQADFVVHGYALHGLPRGDFVHRPFCEKKIRTGSQY